MKSKSVSTTNIDPYEAGVEIGEYLKPLNPEAIIMFASVHYADFSELFAGLYDGLETESPIIIGGTGDGFYEASQVENVGVCALGFNSNGKIKWTLAIEENMPKDSFNAGKNCAQTLLENSTEPPKLSILLASMNVDGTVLANGIRSVIDTPCIGGLTGDDRHYQEGIVLANGAMYENAVALLGMSGDFEFAFNLGSGWKPIGQTAIVEKTNGTEMIRVGGMSTTDFINKQLGKPPTEADLGVLTLAVYDEEGSNRFAVRSPYKFNQDTGSVTYFASVAEGTPVQLCYATRADVLDGVSNALATFPKYNFEPDAALVISCAGRKWILGPDTQEEVNRVANVLPHQLPLIGLPSFGEFSPYIHEDGSYTGVHFHNVTIITLLLGEAA
jgi:hypothetical protein